MRRGSHDSDIDLDVRTVVAVAHRGLCADQAGIELGEIDHDAEKMPAQSRGRCRDRDGEVRRKNGNTRVHTLRDTYGPGFAPGIRGDAKLSTVLNRAAARSLTELLKKTIGRGQDMNFTHYDLGVLAGSEIVEVTLQGNAANVRLMDSANFSAYRSGRQHHFYGGHATRSPVRLHVPTAGHWHLTVDLGGYGGSVQSSVRVV
jgi:hypothetical protein